MWKLSEYLRAIAGNALAQLRIAGKYHLFSSADRKYSRPALYWARRAARSGEPVGYLLAANIILCNEPDEESWKQVFEAYRAAANAGSADGQQALAWCYEQGVGVLKNPALGWHWLNVAAANGSREAQLALAKCYAEGDGVGRDDARALFFLELAQQHVHVAKRHEGNVVPFRRPGEKPTPGG